jgi:hypothetical protein
MADVKAIGGTNQQNTRQLSPQERAILFAQSTRQNFQTMPTQTVTAENTTIQFNLPKVRLLSRILLHVEATATLVSTAGTIATSMYSPYNILRRIALDLNNGFSPVILDGASMYLYDKVGMNSNVYDISTNIKANTYVENIAAAGGRDNKIKFTLNIPLTLNERDSVGLLLLQNDESVVTLTCDIDRLANAYTLNAGNGDTVTFKNMTVTPMLETFSIPPVSSAFPDISVLKLVSSKSDIFQGGGSSVIKLPVGTIYRKMIFRFTDNAGVPLTDDSFVGNFELIFNQADIPYSMKPKILSSLNHRMYGSVLPAGVYVLEFSYNGIPNMAGSRDYVDSERLTELWFRFNSNVAGTVTVINETLSRLQS